MLSIPTFSAAPSPAASCSSLSWMSFKIDDFLRSINIETKTKTTSSRTYPCAPSRTRFKWISGSRKFVRVTLFLLRWAEMLQLLETHSLLGPCCDCLSLSSLFPSLSFSLSLASSSPARVSMLPVPSSCSMNSVSLSVTFSGVRWRWKVETPLLLPRYFLGDRS